MLGALAALIAGCASQRPPTGDGMPATTQTYEETTIREEAAGFFGRGAEGLADVLNRLFRERGDPTGYIKGEEGGGALGVGLRYGRGMLYMRDGTSIEVYWRGPSVGIDIPCRMTASTPASLVLMT